MEPFDGIFAEGSAVNPQGLLGNQATAILWTYSAADCCSTPAAADVFFQKHLALGVYPMAPFPEADHSIARDPVSDAYYLLYGCLFKAMRGATWVLQAHAVSVDNVTATPLGINANAMTTPSSLLWTVMQGKNMTSATLRLRYTASDVGFEVLHPGSASCGWSPVKEVEPQGQEVLVTVPLQHGCALLRQLRPGRPAKGGEGRVAPPRA
jgi:hypothetical protein